MNPTLEKIFNSYFVDYKPIDLTGLQKKVIQQKFLNTTVEVSGRIREIDENAIYLFHEVPVAKWMKYATKPLIESYEFEFVCSLQNIDPDFLFSLKKGEYLNVEGIIEKFEVRNTENSLGILDIGIQTVKIQKTDTAWIDNNYLLLPAMPEMPEFNNPPETNLSNRNRTPKRRKNKRLRKWKEKIIKIVRIGFFIALIVFLGVILIELASEIYKTVTAESPSQK